jgi:hypothetical protein
VVDRDGAHNEEGTFELYDQMHNGLQLTLAVSEGFGRPASELRFDETKPRLGRGRVEILEETFQCNSKPSTQIRRKLAENFSVDLPRIHVSHKYFCEHCSS